MFDAPPAAPRPWWFRVNWAMVLCAAALLVVGVLFVRSACSVRVGRAHELWRQMLWPWIPLGVAAHVVVAAVDYRRWTEWAWAFYLFALVLLALVLVPGIGTSHMGARRWLFGRFQPSEGAKFALVAALAFVLGGGMAIGEKAKLWLSLGLAAVPAALVLLEPDLGTTLPFAAAALAMLFVAGCAKKTLLALVLAAALGASAFLGAILLPEKLPPERREKVEAVTGRFLHRHWKDRVLVFFHPERDLKGAGWNAWQSKIAVGSGGERGKGYMKGTQNALGYLPVSVSSSDFVFSVIAEETGFRGSAAVLGLFALLLAAVAWTGLRCRDEAGRLVCTGVGAILFTHVFVNVAMTIGVMPITGIPLPLVSYGGTFAISTLALLGLVQSVSLHPGAEA
ncbi:MAG: FtsW/RodA/SpoVE family cell cycle protein [Kiritimatiellae bacterium]|nr:FtsW/RodA/SpoVE family cell cycle protein [Kiritimatiellia bacterium]